MPTAEALQLRQPRHRPVIVQNLAQHPRGTQPRQLRKVHRRLRVPRAAQHAARLCAQREDMPRLHQVRRRRGRVRQDADRRRAVRGADARRDPARRIHRHRKIRPLALAIIRHHALKAQSAPPARMVIGTQISPRPNLAMKFTASAVTFSAAITRSPSFSRSSSSTTMTMRPGADLLDDALDRVKAFLGIGICAVGISVSRVI